MGDFNTGINYIDQKGSSFWHSEYLKKFEDMGLFDAFRYRQGSIVDYSWFSHKGNGFRYDHCWVSKHLEKSIVDCTYEHTCRENNLSDHSLMLVQLELERIYM